jgi:hypothetical protein
VWGEADARLLAAGEGRLCGAIGWCAAHLGSSLYGFLNRVGDPLKHRVDVRDHLVVPDSQYLVSLVADEPGTAFVLVRLVGVLRTIEFDNQLAFRAKEVG